MENPGRLTYRIARATPIAASDDDAGIPSVKIPVRCPHCDTEQLCDYPEPVVVMALTRWNNMNLHVPCHDVYWCANQSELQAIRRHLGEAWIKSRSGSGGSLFATSRPQQNISA